MQLSSGVFAWNLELSQKRKELLSLSVYVIIQRPKFQTYIIKYLLNI